MRHTNNSQSYFLSLKNKLTNSVSSIAEESQSFVETMRFMPRAVKERASPDNRSKLRDLEIKIKKLQDALKQAKSDKVKFELLTKIANAFERKYSLIDETQKTIKEEALFNATVYYGFALNLKPNEINVVNQHINLVSLLLNSNYLLCHFAFQTIIKETDYNVSKAYANAYIEQSNGNDKLQDFYKDEAVTSAIFHYIKTLNVNLSKLNKTATQQIQALKNFIILKRQINRGDALITRAESLKKTSETYEKLTLITKSIQFYTKALDLNPDSNQKIKIFTELGHAYDLKALNETQNRTKEFAISSAIHYYLKALKLNQNKEQKTELLVKIGDAFLAKAQIMKERSRNSARKKAAYNALSYYRLALFSKYNPKIFTKFIDSIMFISTNNLVSKSNDDTNQPGYMLSHVAFKALVEKNDNIAKICFDELSNFRFENAYVIIGLLFSNLIRNNEEGKLLAKNAYDVLIKLVDQDKTVFKDENFNTAILSVFKKYNLSTNEPIAGIFSNLAWKDFYKKYLDNNISHEKGSEERLEPNSLALKDISNLPSNQMIVKKSPIPLTLITKQSNLVRQDVMGRSISKSGVERLVLLYSFLKAHIRSNQSLNEVQLERAPNIIEFLRSLIGQASMTRCLSNDTSTQRFPLQKRLSIWVLPDDYVETTLESEHKEEVQVEFALS